MRREDRIGGPKVMGEVLATLIRPYLAVYGRTSEHNATYPQCDWPYVCQRGAVFEIGRMMNGNKLGIPVKHGVDSAIRWWTSCDIHTRQGPASERRNQQRECLAHPVVSQGMLASWRLGGIRAIAAMGQDSYVNTNEPPAPVGAVEKTPVGMATQLYEGLARDRRSQYDPLLAKMWVQMLAETVVRYL